MATPQQEAQAIKSLGWSWARIVDRCRRDLGTHGVLEQRQVAALPIPARYTVGDLVAVWAHQRYRAARVYKVARTRVSALYLTPTQLTDYQRRGWGLSPINITGRPEGLIEPAEPDSATGASGPAVAVVAAPDPGNHHNSETQSVTITRDGNHGKQ